MQPIIMTPGFLGLQVVSGDTHPAVQNPRGTLQPPRGLRQQGVGGGSDTMLVAVLGLTSPRRPRPLPALMRLRPANRRACREVKPQLF